MTESTMECTECVRCGGHHPDLAVWPLANPVDGYRHYARCPATDQPIIVRVLDVSQEHSDSDAR